MIIVAPKKHIDWETQAGIIYEGKLNFLTGEITVVNGSEGAGTYNIAPIPLSTSEGVNNIFADSGDIEVSFKQDIANYVDSKISAANVNRTLSMIRPVTTEESKGDEDER